ncbi:unnamed protein product [Moneuplotes crassus]|uniref:E2 ubiquitin-conjugating enzyme n=1 Tax=Euplotes crassus TaxID=5936 RepID=A0AAD2D810_EUPCR|nr:unnamed protein product [Moneuplotes crassus]
MISEKQENNSLKRINKEYNDLQRNPPFGCSAAPVDEDNMYEWLGFIFGPDGTPYEGGTFQVSITYPKDYPFKPPVVKFITKIYHPNVDSDGLIGLDILRDQWNPSLTIDKILLSICSLLDDPNPILCFNHEIGHQYLEDRVSYDIKAREWTINYAS